MSNVIEETFCDGCGAELECGQVGKYENCRTYKFEELSDGAKQTARKRYISGDYPGYDWWDYIRDGAVRMATLLGIEIDETARLLGKNKRVVKEPKIYFSGFCSQGDGACFEGSYRFAPDAIAAITDETKDEELVRIATELYRLQIARRLLGLEPFSAMITASGRGYSHSGSMDVVTQLEDDDETAEAQFAILSGPVTQLMRDFADWIYGNLETEYNWLCSDEYVDERLIDDEKTFDSDGVEV